MARDQPARRERNRATPVQLDTSTPSSGTAEQGVAQLRRSLKALRRRWWVVALPILIGVGLGWLSTPNAADPIISADNYYKATHTLLLSTPTDGGAQPATPLQQAAYLAATGEVPIRAAETLGIDARDVSRNVQGIARADVSSLEVTAIGRDSDKAEELADTTADALVTFLEEVETEAFQARRDEVLGRLDDLRNERDRLDDEIGTDPGDVEFLVQERDSVVNQYRLAYEQFQNLADAPAPSAGLSTIETAAAVAINESAYRSRQEAIAAGGQVATATSQPEGASETPDVDPNTVVRAGVGGIFGLIVGVAMALTWDRFDTTLRRREEVEAATGLPVLAEVPPLTRHQRHDTEILAAANTRSRTAEAFRVIRTALLMADGADQSRVSDPEQEPSARIILVTSSGPSEGKTTTVANIAAVLAEGGLSVLVIDCDFRRPRIHKYLLEDDENPLLNELDGAVAGELNFTTVDGVKLVHGIGGETEAAPLEIVAKQRRVIEAARRHFDVILLDTAPFLTTNDASELITDADTLLFVVMAGLTKQGAASRASEFLGRMGAPTLGVVLTNADDTPSAYYYYSSYLDSDDQTDKRGTPGRRVKPSDNGSRDRGSDDPGRETRRTERTSALD